MGSTNHHGMNPFWNLTEIRQIGFVASPRQLTKGGSVSVGFSDSPAHRPKPTIRKPK
jgi:hypothetical protein